MRLAELKILKDDRSWAMKGAQNQRLDLADFFVRPDDIQHLIEAEGMKVYTKDELAKLVVMTKGQFEDARKAEHRRGWFAGAHVDQPPIDETTKEMARLTCSLADERTRVEELTKENERLKQSLRVAERKVEHLGDVQA